MDCQAIREHLIDDLYSELAPEAWVQVEQHLLECPDCQEERAALQQVTATLNQWQLPEPPAGMLERTLARIRAEAAAARPVRWYEGLPPAMPLLAVALGGLAALTSLGLTTHLAPHQEPSFILAALGILWAVLYGGMFLAALGAWARPRHLARVALFAGGLSILLAPVLSIPEVVEACSGWLGVAKGSMSLNVLLFVVGGLYTAPPLLLAHLVTGHQPGQIPPGQGLASGLLYLLLVAPVVYLQCAALAMGVGAAWMAGAIVGVLAGGPAGLWLAGRRVAASG